MSAGAIAVRAALALALLASCGPRRAPDDAALRLALSAGTEQPAAAGAPKGPSVISPATLTVLQPATPLRGANGLACKERHLLVAEALGDRIVHVSPDGRVDVVPPPTGLQGPDDVAFDAAGDLLVTAAASGDVWRRRSADGSWSAITRGIADVNAIAADATGRVFVGTCATDGRLLELDPSGQRPPRTIATGLACPNAMTVVGDTLVVPLLGAGTVVRVRIADGTKEKIADGLRAPTAVKQAPDGTLVVLESATGAIRSLGAGNADVGSGTEVARLAPGLDGFTTCGDAAIVSNFLTGELTAVKPWPGAARVLERGGLALPHGLATAGEDVLVSDGVSIRRLRGGAAEVLVATAIDAIPPPFALALGTGGVVWVTVPHLGEVHRIDLAARSSEKVAGGFDRPTSIAAAPGGGVLVADTGAGRIVRVEADGSTKTLASGLVNPLGLAVRGGQILTTEPTGGRVLAVREGSAPSLIASGLAQPAGIAVDAAGNAYVAETRTGAVIRVDTDGSHRKVATGFEFAYSDAAPEPIAMVVDVEGGLLIALPDDGSIVRVTP